MFCKLFSTDRGNSAFLNLLLTLNANGFLLFERYMSQEIHKNNLKILKNSGQASGIPANSFSSSRQMVKDSKDDFSRPADSGRQENNWESGIPHNSTAYEWAPEQWAALRTAIFLNDRSVLDDRYCLLVVARRRTPSSFFMRAPHGSSCGLLSLPKL